MKFVISRKNKRHHATQTIDVFGFVFIGNIIGFYDYPFREAVIAVPAYFEMTF
jgi:hypothetical protein